MKKLYLGLFCILSFTGGLSAQPYGNEWINFATNQPHSVQQYFKVSVWRDGIYRITLADLQAAQFPAQFNPKNLQLFYKGVEQFIHVEGETDGVFDPADYIEFYGKKNDGTADTRLYKHPDNQVKKTFSLFTDTAAYFLTLNANPLIVNRRMVQETDINFIGYSAISYFIREAVNDFNTNYHASEISELVDSQYDDGEGWYSGAVSNSNGGNASFSWPLPVPNVSNDPTAPIAVASSVMMGGNFNSGIPHDYKLDVNGTVFHVSPVGFAVTKFNFPLLSNSSLSSGTATFQFEPEVFPIPQGVIYRNLFSYVKVIYPHSFSFAGESGNFQTMTIPGNLSGQAKSYLNISNLNMGDPKLYMLSGDTLKRIPVVTNGSNREALVPTNFADKWCFLTDSLYTTSSGHMRISSISDDPATFARFTNFLYISQSDYLILSNRNKPDIWNKANDYRTYRATTGFTPLLVDINELYNQFAYGINQHPSSIRNFCEFALDTFILKPEYLLLIGKSISPEDTRYNSAAWNLNLVPTYGYPASDMLLGSLYSPDTIPRSEIAVGRISARTDVDVEAYLDKIMVHELQLQQCPQDWMKQILHFGGGGNISQQTIIKNILQDFEKTAEDTLMGANVHTFLKTSPDPIQVNLSQYLQALIDTGVTIMNFVAHASGTTFDISTDIPQNYNNKDRYPLGIANSCYVGDIHDPARRIIEDFVLLPEKGTLGFIAEPSIGFLEHLQHYTGFLYKHLANFNYGQPIGKIMSETIDSVYAMPVVMQNPFVYYNFKSVCTGMTLSGDPALVLNSFDKPDYEVTPASVYFTPEMITSDLDSFNMNIVIKNLGKAVSDSFVVHILRNFPGNNSSDIFEKDTLVSYVAYKDTVIIRLPVDVARGVGVNYFDVFVDYFGTIDECNEGNNLADSIPLQIQSSDLVPVYPAEFSIVPQPNNIKLKASTVNPFAPVKPYVFQIDTVDTFNSPFMSQGIVTAPGGVVKWNIPFTLSPDLVYYWRVSRDSMPGDTIHPTWKESSFIHKPNLTGWSQAHYSQFKKDEFTNVVYSNSIDTTFDFVTSNTILTVRNYRYPNSNYNPHYELNNVVIDYQMCFTIPSMHIVVLDSISLKPWSTDQYHFGNVNIYNPFGVGSCNRSRPEYYFIFRMTDPASRDSMIDMLQNDIPNGNYVVAYTVYSGLFSSSPWPQAEALFTSWGSDSIADLTDDNTYIFFTKKGDPSFTHEEIGDSVETVIQLTEYLGGNWSKGFVTSVPIGPAAAWTSFHWEQFPLESSSPQDSAAVDIIGIQQNGIEVPIPGFQGIQVGTPDLNINSIDATQYPKLKLRAYLQDEQFYTPPQLKRWQIYYEDIPELALNPGLYFKLNNDTLNEGEDITMEMAIENIGNVDADSVLVDFFLYDKNRVRHNISSPKYKELITGDTLIGKVSFNTGGYDGLNSLWIEANPRNDQPEQYHFNNLAEILFKVNRDITNPILDVTFDGIHILNGDIVSGKPTILIRLKDENKHLALDDTSDWQVFLKNPDGVQTKLFFETTPCSGPAKEFMKWCPATLPQNTFQIEYNPTLLMDGVYELWVQASDVSGNISGDNNYRITFEVINKSTITEVINYPNPFSTSTRFVFTLTGSEIPEYFKIQIMTVSGKIIREITREELGPIHIGRNITEYAWNGKDEFGDQLANGIYLYRVLTKLNGANIEKRSTEADQYFTKGWGKMYLMKGF